MKKLLLFLMLFTVGLTARAQVVYLTLDQDGMVKKTDDAGKIYYAITGKVHNMDTLKLTPSNYCVVAYYSKPDENSEYSFRAAITATETDTTFTLTVPWNVPLNTQVRITCQPKNNYSDLGISPYVFTTCGFQHSITVTGVSWGTEKNITYTCQYKQKTSESTEEAILPSSLKDFNSITFLPIKRTYSLIGESYDGSEYNHQFQQNWGGPYPSGQFGAEDTLNVTDHTTDNTFSFSSSAIAGKLKINRTLGEWGTDTIATKLLSAYTVDLSLKDNATDKNKKVVHAEVTNAAGNKVSGGNINYAIGSGPSYTYEAYEISSMVFYENNLEHYSSVSSVTDASSITDSTYVHTFYGLPEGYHQSKAVADDGTVDIDCDMTNWMNRKIDGSVSNLRIYFWYTPAEANYTDNTSLFYAYKTLNAAVDADKIDKYTAELAEGTKIAYTSDPNDENGGHYTVTLQFKKDGEAADLPKDADGNYQLSGTLDDGTEYSYEFRYFFGREELSDYWYYSSLTDVTDTTHVVGKPGQMTFNISNTKFDDGLVNTTFYLMTRVTVGGITTESVKTYDLNTGYDAACTTGLNYTNYLGDGTNGTGSSKTYDDLTGLLSKNWTTTNGTATTKSGKTWTKVEETRQYYHVSGNTTLSQTVDKDKLHTDGSTFSTSDTYTLQAIVRSEKGANLTLTLKHGDATATKTVMGLGMDENTHSTVNGYGCVDTVYSILSDQELIDMGIPKEDIPKGGWQKLEATVASGTDDGDLTISITSDKNFDLNDVVLLKDANTTGHYLTTVPAIEGDKNGYYEDNDYSKFDLTKYEKFSFFDRGPNVNRVVFMNRNSALFNGMYDPATDPVYVPFNYVIDKQDGTGYKMFRLFLKDGQPYYFPSSRIQGKHQIACDYISYDREFTAGKMSTIALPFTVPVKTIFDWCTTGGYDAIKDCSTLDSLTMKKYGIGPNWGVLKEISANGDVYFGQTWSYAADGSIGGTFRTRTLDSDSKFEGPIMFIKTVKDGKPFMGLKGDDNSGGLVLFTSDEAHSGGMPNAPFTNDDNDKNYAYRMVYACEMKYEAVTDNADQTGYGLQVNSDNGYSEKNNNYLFGTYRPIADIAAMRNTESSDVYHFYYWSAKDGVFRKASEGDGHKAVKCPPFRAFLVAKESSSSAKPSLGFRVVNMYDMGTTTGIKSVTDTTVRRTADNNVYSLTGVLVRRGTSLAGLPNGLYIVNGKKVIVNHN